MKRDDLLFLEIDGSLEFRRAISGKPVLYEDIMPPALTRAIPRDASLTAQEQATKIARASGWSGQDPIDVKSEVGKILKGKRPWYNDPVA